MFRQFKSGRFDLYLSHLQRILILGKYANVVRNEHIYKFKFKFAVKQ